MSIVKTLLLLTALWMQPPSWRLDDQYGRSRSSEEFAGKPVLLIAGGSAAAETFDAWIDAVAAEFGAVGDSLPFSVLGIADVGSAPRVVYPLIRLRLPRDRARPVLIDPNGAVSRRYGIEPQTSNQLVVGHHGAVLVHLRGIPVDTANVRILARQLRAAVEAAARTRSALR